MSDLVLAAFLALRGGLFSAAGDPKPFALRPKHNTQDDPFDEMLATTILTTLPGIVCEQATGPLITPDLVLYRPELCRGVGAGDLADALNGIVAIEVKKLERSAQGSVARASGLDYNTTPPCGLVRVYDAVGQVLDIRGFYLFVCLEPAGGEQVAVTALALVDGNLLNADFSLYLSIVGERAKRIGLGSYADGADRTRPMLIFANPLGIPELSRGAWLVHPEAGLAEDDPAIRKVLTIERSVPGDSLRRFSCYQAVADVGAAEPRTLVDPFPTPLRRSERTSPRGRFRVGFRVS